MPDLVLTKITDGCATVTMNRPEARNAISIDLIEALADALRKIEGDARASPVRVLTLAGAGEAFCAGMDLEAVTSDRSGTRRMLRGLSRLMRQIRSLTIPTIARVQGAAIGGGCGLMVVTDFAVTHPQAKIGYPEVSLGVCPAVVAPWLMRKIGSGRARAMLLAGQTVNGRQAFELGLATHLTRRDRVDAETAALAARLGEDSPPALAATKRWLNELEGPLDDEVIDKGADLSAEVAAGAEARARLRSRRG
jgi:methylglutaconyl-CoA hydratase